MSVRRWISAGLATLALLAPASCGAAPEPRKPGAWVHIALLPNGDAQLDLFASGRRIRTDADVVALARRVAGEAFPEAAGFRVRMASSHGRPFARADVAGAYRPGRTASLRIATAGAWRHISAQGFEQAGLRLYLPAVPAAVEAAPHDPDSERLGWRLRKDRPAPELEIVMRPEPARWYGAMALPVAGAAGVALAFFARRRLVAVPAAGTAVAGAAAAIAFSAGRQGENLGVAGLLDGRALDLATVAPLAAVPLGLPAVLLLGTMAVRAARGPGPSRHPETRPQESGAFW
ncbi:hypothetical protein [Spirillospora sp. NPDC029432]|uniref:hypothetical protein n=1 Tax=Spirillospora sp. NPDC029432 TaxID=3154599 RepID=UPI0034543696